MQYVISLFSYSSFNINNVGDIADVGDIHGRSTNAVVSCTWQLASNRWGILLQLTGRNIPDKVQCLHKLFLVCYQCLTAFWNLRHVL